MLYLVILFGDADPFLIIEQHCISSIATKLLSSVRAYMLYLVILFGDADPLREAIINYYKLIIILLDRMLS